MPLIRYALLKTVFLIALCVGLATPNGVFSDTEKTYCELQERFAPNGRIVELGGRYFHICGAKNFGRPYNLDPQVGKLRIRIGKKSSLAEVASLAFPQLPDLWGFIHLKERYITVSGRDHHVAQIRFGNADYDVFSTESNALRQEEPADKGNLPSNLLIAFKRGDGSNTPDHHMLCNKDPTVLPPQKQQCSLYVRYEKHETLVIDYIIFWSPFFGGEPFDFERLPKLAYAINFLFESIDVTDRLEALEQVPIVRVADETD